MRSKVRQSIPDNAAFGEEDKFIQIVEQEIEQEAENRAEQINVSETGDAIAVGLEGSVASVTSNTNQVNTLTQNIDQDQLGINANAGAETVGIQ